jgi:pimeloyl-ACP methyl ester carboxylesterase
MKQGRFSFHKGPMPGEPRGARFAEVDGVRVRYVDVGEGPPVALVHGFASSLETWAEVVPPLSLRHRVIALDLKGFGWTDRPEGNYSPRAQADLVMGLLAARGVDRTALVGHSYGAAVVLQAALAYPERVERIAIYDAFLYHEQVPTFFHWARVDGVGETLFAMFYRERPEERMRLAFHDQAFVTERLVHDVERALARPGTLAAALETIRAFDYGTAEGRYSTLRKPALVMWGREDKVTPLAFGERLAKDLSATRLVTYPRCGHFPMIEAARASTADLTVFLGQDLKKAV